MSFPFATLAQRTGKDAVVRPAWMPGEHPLKPSTATDGQIVNLPVFQSAAVSPCKTRRVFKSRMVELETTTAR
jgi:hypothetical protein